MRLGGWSLALAALSLVWLIAGFSLAVGAARSGAPDWLGYAAAPFVFGWFVVPLAFLMALVLGISALLLNARRGKAMGAAAIGMLALQVAVVLVFWAAALGAFTSTAP